MTAPKYKHDVAISFLHNDEPLAIDLQSRLAPSLNTFVYSKHQEELAGTDGLQSFRTVFRSDARLVVVLFRDGWGQTPWTRVEEGAIQDRFLKEGWNWLLVVMLDKVSSPPPWLPEARIRMSLPDFGIEQTVGAIRLRAQELGSIQRTENAIDKARRLASTTELKRQISQRLDSDEAIVAVAAELRELRSEISRLVAEAASEAPSLAIQAGSKARHTTLTNGHVSLTLDWHQPYTNTLSDSVLTATEFIGRVMLPNQAGTPVREARELGGHTFQFTLTAEHGWCWLCEADGRHYRSKELAGHCLEQLLDLIRRLGAGELSWSDFRPVDPLDDDDNYRDAFSGY
jgi:hypothetical protein